MDVKIYLSGGMSGLSLEEQLKWRNQIENAVKVESMDCIKKPYFFNPPLYYSPTEESIHKSEREVMEFELSNLRNSDIVVVNFNVPNSIGTAMELAVAKEHNIPIVGLNKDGVKLHPWLEECCMRMCLTTREVVNYLLEFYLKR